MKWPRGTSAKRTARGKGSATFVPMRASTFQPSSPEELGAFLGRKDCDYELKVDGVRVLADRRDGAASLTFRSGLPAAFPEVVEALEGHAHEGTVYDGEVVAFDEAGRPSFASLAPRLHRRSASSATHVVGEAVVYLVFDVLVLRGQTVANLPLSERRTLLEACAFSGPNVRVHPALTDGLALLSFAKTHGLEGIVRKERNSPYVFGPKAHPAWQKLKLEQEDDFVIVGYVTKGTRFVSLEVASFEVRTAGRREAPGTDRDAPDQNSRRISESISFSLISRSTESDQRPAM